MTNEELVLKYKQTKNQSILGKILTRNRPLIIKLGRKFCKGTYSIDDMIQDGTIGLMHAIELYDVSKGYKLMTYARLWIIRQIEEGMLINYNFSFPKFEVLSNISKNENHPLHYRLENFSLDVNNSSKNNDEPLVSYIADETDWANEVESKINNEKIINLLNTNYANDKYYNVYKEILTTDKSFAKIGEEYGYSREYVRVLNNKLMNKLKLYMYN